MQAMKYLKSIKQYWIDYAFLAAVATFLWIYYVVTMTPGKAAWYTGMFEQIHIALRGITDLL